jgi:2-polyprenyl-6-methoxyphenol hydroxylase-like FAD-dependent oxidoreductase
VTEDLIIVGGGPTGLMLACELRLCGVRPLVLERLPEPTGLSKALGLAGRAVALLDHRGLLPRFQEHQPVDAGQTTRLFHFGGIPIDIRRLEGEPPKFIFVPQAITERLLVERAIELKVELLRGHELVGLEQSADHCTLRVRTAIGEQMIQAPYVVGCDGGRSTVREFAGIGFPGTRATRLLRLGDVKFAAATPNALTWDSGRPPFPPLDGGYFRVITTEPLPADFDRETPMTLDELRESVRRTTGRDVAMTEARWLSRFTDASRQADQYQKGRVILAGDAAHIQLPAGGPGLSTGLSDAMNLGWKLAADIQGWAPPGLLATYHAERHPAGARVLMHTRAQGALLASGEHTAALRELFGELMQDRQTVRRIVDLLQGNDVRYAMGDADDSSPLMGGFAPELTLVTTRGQRRLPDLMHRARGVLLDLADNASLRDQAASWSDRIDVITAECPEGAPADALLIRPDGYVAWAGTNRDALDRSLRRWFGDPKALDAGRAGEACEAETGTPTT